MSKGNSNNNKREDGVTRKNKKKRRNKNKRINEDDFFNSKNPKNLSPSPSPANKITENIRKESQPHSSPKEQRANELANKNSKSPASPSVDLKASPEERRLDSSVDDTDDETSEGENTPKSPANGTSLNNSSSEINEHVISDLREQLDGANAKIQGLRQHVAKLKKTKTTKKKIKGRYKVKEEEEDFELRCLTKRSSFGGSINNQEDLAELIAAKDALIHIGQQVQEGKIGTLSRSDEEEEEDEDDNPTRLSRSVSLDFGKVSRSSFLNPSKSLDNLRSSLEIPYLSKEDINAKDKNGRTPLHNAAQHGDIEFVGWLLEKNASVDERDLENYTPLVLACKAKHHAVIHMLLDAGADVGAADNNGNTSLHWAVLNNFTDIIDTLLYSGADVNSVSNNGNTPLLLAVSSRQIEICDKLINWGAAINTRSKYQSPLILAASSGFSEIVSLLAIHRADLNIQDATGSTALHRAAKAGFQDIIEILVEEGANPRIKNDHGQTPLDLALTPPIRKILEDYDPGTKCWKWEIDYNTLQTDKKPIGEGNFSICYRGKLHGTPVAVKQLKIAKITEPVMQSFEHEVGLMSDIKHPNILLFLGACTKTPLCMITEYLPLGSLRGYLDAHTINWAFVVNFALGIARGMAWLHSRKPVVLHRDLHSGNVLVTNSLEPKIGDFGLSLIQGQNYHSTPIYKRCCPPEVIKGMMYTRASDVYSFGLILAELLTGKKADATIVKTLYDDFNFKVEIGIMDYKNLIISCCSSEPPKRPNFEQILDILETIAQKHEDKKREEKIETRKELPGEYIDG